MPGSGTAVPPVEPPEVVLVELPPLLDDDVVDELVEVDDDDELPLWQPFLQGLG